MGKLGTKSVKVGGGSLPKSFSPGNHECKINEVRLKRPPFAKQGEVQYYIEMDLETAPIAGLEGFLIDSKDESKGRYLGQTGRVKSSEWPYKDSSWQGKTWDMNEEIMKFIKSLCITMKSDWMDKADGVYDTIEDLVEAFNNEAPFKDVMFAWCIGGQQVQGDDGYPKYYMHLPKYTKGSELFTLADDDDSILIYDKALHLKVKGGAPATVTSFPATPANGDALFAPAADDNEDPFAPSDDDNEDPFAPE